MSAPSTLGAAVYTQGSGSVGLGSLGIIPISSQIAPSAMTTQGPSGPLKLGQMWIDVETSSIYLLANLHAVNGAITANWQQITSGTSGGTVDALQGDTGAPVLPVAGTVSVGGIAHQTATSNVGNSLKIGFTNGISIGSYQPTAPPVGGLLVPGQSAFGTSTPNSNAFFQLNNPGTFAYTFNNTGTMANTDGSGNMIDMFVNSTFAPFSGANLVSGVSSFAKFYTPAAQTVNNAAAFASAPLVDLNAGIITRLTGFYAAGIAGVAGGTITSAYGGFFANPGVGTTRVALYSDDMTVGDSTKQAGTGNIYVAGFLNLGGTASKILINATVPATAGVGQSQLAGGTVTVTNANVSAVSKIFITRQENPSAVVNSSLYIADQAVGSFIVASDDAGDTSFVNWLIIN